MSKPAIGFIGLGLMGFSMCQRLLSKDYPLTVMANRSRNNIDAIVAKGATEVSTPKEMAKQCDAIFLCVDTSQSVEACIYGDQGIMAGLSEGKIVIDFGTSLPASTRKIAKAVSDVGAIYLDAPIGRTPAHALQGQLNLMCAGDKAGFDKIEPVLQDLAENVFYLGASGNGHVIKLLNNFYGMTMANAMAEVFTMADKMGVDREQVYSVIAAGPLHSSMMDFVKAYAVDDDPSALAFSISNAAKDVGYYTQMADEAGIQSIMSKSAHEALSKAAASGYGDQMVSQMFDFFRDTYMDE